MRLTLKPLLLASLISLAFSSQSIHAQQFSGINNISFHDGAYDKAFAGNGFLLEYKNNLYAITVKHTFLEAKTPEMKSVTIDGFVKEWRIHPNKQPNDYIKLGRLLNANINEAIDMNILQKDWLIFEVEENHSSLSVLKLRETQLITGDKLTAYGCSYANQAHCLQDVYVGTFISSEPNNLRISIPNLALNKLRGLSGSPVLDKNNQLVGIVSNVLKSQTGEGFDFAPANLNYLKQVLESLEK